VISACPISSAQLAVVSSFCDQTGVVVAGSLQYHRAAAFVAKGTRPFAPHLPGVTTMKTARWILALALAVGASSAFAGGGFPQDMAAIDAALAANPKVSAEQLAEVKKLRADGEAAHNAGDHAKSTENFAKAKAILGI
jgi:hypothetical protein